MYQPLHKLIKARKKVRSLYNLVAFLLLPALALTQATGKLSGKIVDEKTNESISGASITAVGTKYGTSSIIDGTYILTLPVGTYIISYSSKGSGYATKEVPGIVIKAGETNYQNILLSSGGDLTTVTIKAAPGRKGGTISSVFNLQKRASGAQDGISIDVIVKTPDNNAAQISKRIVGVSVQDNRFVVVRGLAEQYNQTILNGVPMTSTETDRNAFSLDLIPSAVIENIIVNKTATPDMPGNFAGGLVQINTKDFPASNFISVSLQGSINDQTYGKDFYSDKKGKL
ncbi:MAG: carboxypeptidase regulatory-like domain-containing protein, partial [Chitinophagaceae bacterium]